MFSMLVYMLLLNRGKILSFSKVMIMGIALIVVCGAVFVMLPSQVNVTVSARFVPSESETVDQFTSGRTQIWRNGIQIFMEAPIIGHGHHSFTPLLERKYFMHAAAHNKYLSILVNYGFVGLVIFLMVYLKLFQSVWEQLINSRDDWNKKLYMSYLAGFSGYLFSLLGINAGASRLPFWIYAAVICAYCKLDKQNKTNLSTLRKT